MRIVQRLCVNFVIEHAFVCVVIYEYIYTCTDVNLFMTYVYEICVHVYKHMYLSHTNTYIHINSHKDPYFHIYVESCT